MYDSILLATDGSQHASEAVHHGIELAATFGSTVHVLFVVDVDVTDRAHEEMLRSQGETFTNEAVLEASQRGLEATPHVREGYPAEEIVDFAVANHVDLVVIGTRGRSGIERHLLGSVAEAVVRTAPVPVLTVQADG